MRYIRCLHAAGARRRRSDSLPGRGGAGAGLVQVLRQVRRSRQRQQRQHVYVQYRRHAALLRQYYQGQFLAEVRALRAHPLAGRLSHRGQELLRGQGSINDLRRLRAGEGGGDGRRAGDARARAPLLVQRQLGRRGRGRERRSSGGRRGARREQRDVHDVQHDLRQPQRPYQLRRELPARERPGDYRVVVHRKRGAELVAPLPHRSRRHRRHRVYTPPGRHHDETVPTHDEPKRKHSPPGGVDAGVDRRNALLSRNRAEADPDRARRHDRDGLPLQRHYARIRRLRIDRCARLVFEGLHAKRLLPRRRPHIRQPRRENDG